MLQTMVSAQAREWPSPGKSPSSRTNNQIYNMYIYREIYLSTMVSVSGVSFVFYCYECCYYA